MTELSDADVFGAQKEMSDSEVFAPQEPTSVPQGFLDRIARGQAITDQVERAASESPNDAFEAAAARTRGTSGPGTRKSSDFTIYPEMFAASLFHGVVVAPILAAKDLTEQALSGKMVSNDPENIAKSLSAGGLALGLGSGRAPVTMEGSTFSRLNTAATGDVEHQVIGGLPKPEDFKAAAAVLDSPNAESNLKAAWEDHGIHPAEAAHDAQGDAFLKQELTAPSFVAYHGSPYDFRAFDVAKIGEGEGAQSYGHGLYFAESEGVARSYKERLGQKNVVAPVRATNEAVNWLRSDRAGEVSPEAIDEVKYGLQDFAYHDKRVPTDGELADYLHAGLEKGELYQVRISADREHFLDWDKPISEQSERVQEGLRALGWDPASYALPDGRLAPRMGGPKGADVVKSKMNESPEATSRALSDAGIPGIKYLDQGSRGAGDGTRNFVVFDHGNVEITHKNGAPVTDPLEMAQAMDDTGFTGGPAGADVTRPENLPTLEEQPAPPPGRLVDAARAGVDQLLGLGRNIQYMLDPMSTGSNRAMVIAKDAISTVRRVRWEHARVDQEIMRRFDAEQQERMWNAADEESVALQLGESREHQGLATLEPEERNFVEYVQGHSQAAWLRARDVGMVEGEGLPAYSPRMVLNVAAASEHAGPQALNELGRNVFTRTSQMLHRKYMMAEETEAAAKEMVGKRMAERGASVQEIEAAMAKVQIARNIRSLPVATARLQEAAIWKDMINKIEDVGKATGSDSVAVGFKPDGGWFTIAGHPSFTKWEPVLEKNPVTGEWAAKVDDAGNTIFGPKPIYIHPEFKGPLTSILDETPQKAPGALSAPSLYGALMAIKGKSMQAVLNSPLIHNEVVWSKVMEAAGGREWLGFGLYFKGNRIVEGNPARAGELITRGLNPIGPRGSIQDITAMMEEPNLTPARSWTAKVLGAVPGLFDPAAGTAVRTAIDRAGDFWHNTLLWDRVRDLQFGLADHLSDRLVAKGTDRLTADRVASHFSNIIVGSVPKEAMSAGARATANLFLFSRSFTLGNLSTFKQAAMGLPKPILAQVERDFGLTMPAGTEEEIAAATAKVKQDAQSLARRKAFSTILMSAGLYYTGNAIIQHAFNIAARDSSLEEEANGYAQRYADLMKDVKDNPFELRHLVGRLSPTYDNEPGKQDRALIGHDKDGSAIYARNPSGKFGEEMIGYPTMPLEMVKRKLSPMAGGILEVLENDKGFGRKIYDENDKTIGGDVATAFAVAKHLVMRHLPEGQINAAVDLLRGDGDPTVNKLRLFGPAAGFTASVGAPGGPARGEQLAAKSAFDARFNIAWPDIRKQIQRGDEDGAREALTGLRVPPGMQRALIRNAQDPASALHGRTLSDFYKYATPQQIERMDRVRQ